MSRHPCFSRASLFVISASCLVPSSHWQHRVRWPQVAEHMMALGILTCRPPRSFGKVKSAGCSKIRTAPISGGFLINSNMSSFSRFLSLRIFGSLAACGTENLSLSGVTFVISFCSFSGCSSPQVWRMVSIFPLICAVGSVYLTSQQSSSSTCSQSCNAGGPKLRTPGVPIGICSTSQQGHWNGG